jgi:hypothetical protein
MRKSIGYNRNILNTGEKEVRKLNKNLKGWPFESIEGFEPCDGIGNGSGGGPPQ